MDRTDNLLEELVAVKELNDTAVFLADEEINKTLVRIIKLLEHPNIDPKNAAVLINRFTAQYFIYKLKYKHYMLHKDEPDARAKKELYATVSDALYEVIQSLKYVAKMNTL